MGWIGGYVGILYCQFLGFMVYSRRVRITRTKEERGALKSYITKEKMDRYNQAKS